MEIEKEISKLKNEIVNLGDRVASIEKLITGPAQPHVKKSISIKEFILTKKPKDDNQKILVIAYFLEKYDGLTSFNVKDLASGFEGAKEKTPANINDRVNKIIANKGHIMEAKEKKDNLNAWLLTNSGERFVDENLPPEK